MENQYPCEDVVPVEQEPRHRPVLENEFVRVLAVDIAPHERTLCHHHAHDYVLYVLDIADIISTSFRGEAETLLYFADECQLLPAGLVHVVENLRDTAFRNVVIELFPRFSELRRGDYPKLSYTDETVEDQRLSALKQFLQKMDLSLAVENMKGLLTTIRPRFQNELVRVFRSKLQDKTELRVFGPAVIVSPQGGVTWQEAGGSPLALTSFKDVAWVAPQAQGTVRGSKSEFVILQLGAAGEQQVGVREQSEPLRSLKAHAPAPAPEDG